MKSALPTRRKAGRLLARFRFDSRLGLSLFLSEAGNALLRASVIPADALYTSNDGR